MRMMGEQSLPRQAQSLVGEGRGKKASGRVCRRKSVEWQIGKYVGGTVYMWVGGCTGLRVDTGKLAGSILGVKGCKQENVGCKRGVRGRGKWVRGIERTHICEEKLEARID